MKRLILILGLMVASVVAAQAQYAYPSEITSRGSKIIADGEVLTAQHAADLFSEFGGEQMGEDYLKNRKGFRVGLGLSIAGPPVFAVGGCAYVVGALMTIDPQHAPQSYIICYTGATLAVSGLLMTVAGIPTACVCRHRIKNAASDYNDAVKSKPVVTFSPARSGIGLAMTF